MNQSLSTCNHYLPVWGRCAGRWRSTERWDQVEDLWRDWSAVCWARRPCRGWLGRRPRPDRDRRPCRPEVSRPCRSEPDPEVIWWHLSVGNMTSSVPPWWRRAAWRHRSSLQLPASSAPLKRLCKCHVTNPIIGQYVETTPCVDCIAVIVKTSCQSRTNGVPL